MAYYDALKTAWAILPSGDTTAQKLAAINAMTVAGPNRDVQAPAIVAYLALNAALLPLKVFASGSANSNATHDAGLAAAATLFAILDLGTDAPVFGTSDPSIYATVKGMLDAILAEETATPGSTGVTQAVHDGLLALATTTVRWATAPTASGGGALSSPVNGHDLCMAGLIDEAEANAVEGAG